MAASKIISAARKLVHLIEWLQRTIGLKYYTVWHPHACSLTAHSLMPYLDRPGVPELYYTLITALTAVSRRWALVRGILKTLWVTLSEQKLDRYLGDSTVSLFRISAIDSWGPEDHRLFESCAYPTYAQVRERGRAYEEMGDLLQRWSGLEIRGETAEDE
jgi:hypothetical protein